MTEVDGPGLGADRPRRSVVLGLGNLLLGDDGVGVAVARELEAGRGAGRYPLGERVEVVDGGTLGLDLLSLIDGADQVVVVDAVDLGRAPGEVEVLEGAAIDARLAAHLSPHEVGVADLLATARLMGSAPERLAIVGIQPATIRPGIGLSEAVSRAVPVAARAACEALGTMLGTVAGAGAG